jgi:hypothetical protein
MKTNFGVGVHVKDKGPWASTADVVVYCMASCYPLGSVSLLMCVHGQDMENVAV